MKTSIKQLIIVREYSITESISVFLELNFHTRNLPKLASLIIWIPQEIHIVKLWAGKGSEDYKTLGFWKALI